MVDSNIFQKAFLLFILIIAVFGPLVHLKLNPDGKRYSSSIAKLAMTDSMLCHDIKCFEVFDRGILLCACIILSKSVDEWPSNGFLVISKDVVRGRLVLSPYFRSFEDFI